MSRIDKLIRQLCPDGVESKAFGEIGELVRGHGLPKTDFRESGIGAIHYGQIYTYYGTWTTDTISFVAPETALRLAKVDPSDIIITNTSENLKDVGKAVAWLGAEQIVTGGHATVLKHDQDPKFIAYWLQSSAFQIQKKKHASGTKVIDVSAKSLAKIRIPVPPLEVQREITNVLDSFSSLEAELEVELETELEARRHQYEYYRNLLLTFPRDGEARWATLEEVSTRVSSGGTPTSSRTDFYGGEIPWLRTQEIDYAGITSTGKTITTAGLKNSSAKWIPEHCVIVAMYGATAAKVAINEIPLTTNQACCNLQIDPTQAEYRYVFHWVANEYERLKALGEGSQSNLNTQKVRKYPIPVPPLDRQREIVSVLDNFDALVNDLSDDLRSELNARRSQYEYYRDKILTFEEAPV